MSAPVPAPQEPVAPETIVEAVVRAERRLRLLETMIEFCMALLRALRFGGAADGLLDRARDEAFAAISRALRLAETVRAETRRLLRDLRAGILPVPRARRPAAPSVVRPARRESAQTCGRAPREAGRTASLWAFRSRLKALEALLDQDHEDGFESSPREKARRLCRVLGLKAGWGHWVDDDWIDDAVDLKRLRLMADASHPSVGEAPGGLPVPVMIGARRPANAYESESFRQALYTRTLQAIRVTSTCGEEFAEFLGDLNKRFARQEPYTFGGHLSLRGAVQRLCEAIRLSPDFSRWRDGGWDFDVPPALRLDYARPPPFHALE